MKNLYDYIDAARKFEGQPPTIQESVNTAEQTKADLALALAKRLGEAKKEEPEEKRLAAMPVPN